MEKKLLLSKHDWEQGNFGFDFSCMCSDDLGLRFEENEVLGSLFDYDLFNNFLA